MHHVAVHHPVTHLEHLGETNLGGTHLSRSGQSVTSPVLSVIATAAGHDGAKSKKNTHTREGERKAHVAIIMHAHTVNHQSIKGVEEGGGARGSVHTVPGFNGYGLSALYHIPLCFCVSSRLCDSSHGRRYREPHAGKLLHLPTPIPVRPRYRLPKRASNPSARGAPCTSLNPFRHLVAQILYAIL